MSAIEVGTRLVELVNQDKNEDFVNELYSDDIVSIEAQGTDEMPARLEGIEAIRGKHQWWYENNEVHSSVATGPFVGGHENRFAVLFDLDTTPKGGERMQMREVALYTVENGKIVEEEFWYLMA